MERELCYYRDHDAELPGTVAAENAVGTGKGKSEDD